MEERIAESTNCRQSMQGPGDIDAAQHVHQLLRPRCPVKLERQPGRRKQYERRDDDDVHPGVHRREAPYIPAVTAFVNLVFTAQDTDKGSLQPKYVVDTEEGEDAEQ